MMPVMGTRPPTIDHGATLLEIYDRAVGAVFTSLCARCGGRTEWDAVLDRHVVGEVMAELGAHHRSALSLRYFDGLPVPNVAAHLGPGSPAARSWNSVPGIPGVKRSAKTTRGSRSH